MSLAEVRLRLAENGRVVIPAHVRRELGVDTGDEIILQKDEDSYRLTTQEQRLEQARKNLRRYIKPGSRLVDELIAERREAARHE